MKYFLVFFDDDSSREAANSYYTTLVIAKDENEALDKYFNAFKHPISEPEKVYHQAIEVTPIQ